jgi:Rrf2 family protein
MAIMQVSRKVDYALRAVIHLADAEESERICSVGEISTRERIPRQFLEKIVQELIHKGLVRSRRGPRGGYVRPGRPTR